MIRDQLAEALRATLSSLEVEPLPDTIQLERPARREHGDWASNVALVSSLTNSDMAALLRRWS